MVNNTQTKQPKNNLKNKTRGSKGNIKYGYIFVIIICSMVFLILFLLFIIYKVYQPKNNKFNNKRVSNNNSISPQIIPFKKENTEYNQHIEIEINGSSYYGNLTQLFINLKKHIYITKDSAYKDRLNEFAKSIKPEYIKNYSLMLEYINKSNAIISINKIQPQLSIKTRMVNYYHIACQYARIIHTAFKSFESNELQAIITVEGMLFMAYTNEKYLYQQLHINSILTTFINILAAFKKLIINNMNSQANNKPLFELYMKVYNFMCKMKTEMFDYYSSPILFNFYGETIMLTYLLKNLKQYEKFLLFNYYLIFINVFKIDVEYKVIGINDDFLHSVWKQENYESRDYGMRVEKDLFISEIIKSCGTIFISLVRLKEEDDFLGVESDIFYRCKESLFDVGFKNIKEE